ncbi:PH (Pleckstrin Homology) domain-containing protein [Dyadobacter jejuensis]|uniref:PH (Pleckstrin Homology) domain-containing protein n=1 Tax=Dyadobacter jejuensis TaxID=1082580 RepID=A0A316AH06_9BACT|nr:PH domain-containing protein [Dyadobacter jejuensis]PWJ57086.1 PH (Pleckstrin Homology) domain-containing protein [Dyadobacter jejuensis]
MKIYKANRKGFINYLLIGSLILPIIVFYLEKSTFTEKPFILLPLLSPLILIFWIYFDTYYKIENNKLIYRSGFLRGKIEILNIKEILKGETKWSGIKPALARNGLIIKFNKYDEVYVAPENNDELISDLIKLNSEIKITE